MANLKTTYLGLELRNPVIVSSCGLTSRVDRIRRLEEAGAGAVVLKSLFEEQINHEVLHMDNYGQGYPEAADYINTYVRSENLEKYMDLIRGAKQACGIPVIASINCVRGGEWVPFAREIERAGADALELNVFFMPDNPDETSVQIDNRYLETVDKVISSVSLPVSVKLSSHFTNPLHIIRRIAYLNAKGAVLFNRFYEPDIDIERIRVVSGEVLSRGSDLRSVLRWIGMAASEEPGLDLAASTGIDSGESVVKVLLAGARAAQVCSVLYRKGDGAIGEMLGFLEDWMRRHDFGSTERFVGLAAQNGTVGTEAYERAQFMKYFSSYPEE